MGSKKARTCIFLQSLGIVAAVIGIVVAGMRFNGQPPPAFITLYVLVQLVLISDVVYFYFYDRKMGWATCFLVISLLIGFEAIM